MKRLAWLLALCLLWPSLTQAAVQNCTIAWTARTEADLAGYRISWRTASGTYTSFTNVGLVTTTTCASIGITSAGTYYLGAMDYGIDIVPKPAADAIADGRYAVLLHATARAEKQWPEQHWIALGQTLAARSVKSVLPWGSPAERERSERIAAVVPGARVPDKRPLDQVAGLIAGASAVVGVDTGLLHVAAALGVPLVAIFLASTPELTRPLGSGPIAILGRKGGQVSLAEVEAAVDQVVQV